MIVKKLLSDWKATIEFADNGKIAVDKLLNGAYDLVLMDIQMPEMDGYAATKKIRTELPEPFCSTPIMAMTAYATPVERQKSLDCGMNDYISKPFNPADLKRKIAGLKPGKSNHEAGDRKPEAGGNYIATNKQPGNNIPQPVINVDQPEPEMTINLSYLREVSGNNAEFITQMIELFLQKTPEALEEMNERFRQQNWEELRNIAHRIKPSYTYVGLAEIHKMLAEIEREALENHSQTNVDKVSTLISEVGSKSKEAFKALKEELGQIK
jgi:CheY-like chemotaxis protein